MFCLRGYQRFSSARRPAEAPAAEHVHVQMRHRVRGVLTDVENEAVTALGDLLVSRHLASHLEQFREKISVFFGKRRRVAYVTPGDHLYVHGRLGVDVPEGEHVVSALHDLGWHLPRDDAAEDAARLAHSRAITPMLLPTPVPPVLWAQGTGARGFPVICGMTR